MKILCKCGNMFDFENADGCTVDGFEFMCDDEELVIHCKKCDKAVVLSNPEEVEA